MSRVSPRWSITSCITAPMKSGGTMTFAFRYGSSIRSMRVTSGRSCGLVISIMLPSVLYTW